MQQAGGAHPHLNSTIGIVPPCFESHGIDADEALTGTYLLPSGNLSYASGGFCDDTPPTCDPDTGCRWVVGGISGAGCDF